MWLESFWLNENQSWSIEKPKSNPLTPEQIEEFSNSQKLYKQRLALIELRSITREMNYETWTKLLQENPNQINFVKFEWKYYKDKASVIQETWKDKIEVETIPRNEIEQYIKTYEKEEQTSKNIDRILRDNPNQETFYELDWKYYASNPTRVPWNEIWSILLVKEVSRDELESKLEWLEKWIIEWISLRLDRLIANTNDWNLRNYLMDLRTNISLNWNNDFILTFWERVWQLLNLFEKAETKTLNVLEILDIIKLSINILRSWISDLTKVIISYIKDISSNKLYKFWDEDSYYEALIREDFEKWNISNIVSLLDWILPENHIQSIKEIWIWFASRNLATYAWGIDWFLDYIQSWVDIVVTPDTMIQNVGQIWKELLTNWWVFIEELLESFKWLSDVNYVLSYIISVVLCFIYYPSKLWVLALPKTIMKWLEMSWKIPKNMLWNVEAFLWKNLQKIEVFVNDKAKWLWVSSEAVSNSWKKAIEWWIKTRDTLDSSNTLISSIQVNARLLQASREALAITNNSLKLAQIFWDSILWRTNDALTTKNAMNVYREMILKWDDNRFNTDDIDALIEKTKWETRYNLVLVRDKLLEVERVMESEVLPVFELIKNPDFDELDNKELTDRMKLNKDKYNNLAFLIFEKYLPGFLKISINK